MQENVSRLKSLMQKHALSVIVASTPANVTYMTGFRCLSHQLLRDTKIYALISREKEDKPVLIAPLGELDIIIDTEIYVDKIVPYGRFYFVHENKLPDRVKAFIELAGRSRSGGDPDRILVEEIIKKFDVSGTVGVDDPTLVYLLSKKMEGNAEEVKLKDASNVFQQARIRKTKKEISTLKRSAEIVERAIEYCLKTTKEGETEKSMAKKFNKFVIDQGGIPVFTIIGFGERSAYPNVEPSERKLTQGDVIRFDVGCMWGNYCSDISRTVVFGTPTKKHREYYEAIHAGLRRAIDEVKPGVKVSDIFHVAVNTVKKTIPHYRRHHCGHGIGLEIFEPPVISPKNDALLEEGMMLCVETPYYELGWCGLQIEDEIIVTQKGCEYLTHKDLASEWW